jgi:Ca2+-binding RTX toxin-like protein
VRGTYLADYIVGSAASNILDGGEGADTIFGGDGNDSISASGAGAILHGGKGNDTIASHGGGSKLFGEDGDDSLTTETFDEKLIDTLDGGNGNDRLVSFSNCRMFGGAGDDFLDTHGGGKDTLDGGPGSDHALIDELDITVNVELADLDPT